LEPSADRAHAWGSLPVGSIPLRRAVAPALEEKDRSALT
jgi:hypothetical protein